MLAEQLAEKGIFIRGTDLGDYRTQCPQCSPQRRKKRDACLSVTIDSEGALWLCHHCGWGGGFYERAVGGSDRIREKPRHLPSDFGTARRRLRNNVLPTSARG